MDSDFWKKLLDRSPIVIIPLGLVVFLIGAGSGLNVATVSLPIPELGIRVAVMIFGAAVAVFGAIRLWKDSSKKDVKDSSFAGKLDVVILNGSKPVYDEACRLIEICGGNEIIRATSLGLSPERDQSEINSAWETYLRCLASKIREAKEDNRNMEYRVAMGFKADAQGNPPPHKKKAIQSRRRAFKKEKVLDRMIIKSIDTKWFVEIVVIGKSYVIIGFPVVTGDSELKFGLRISNEAFVDEMIRWFDQFVWHSAENVSWTGER